MWINAYRVVAPSVGGFGQSGVGRENGAEAVLAYTESGTRDRFTLG